MYPNHSTTAEYNCGFAPVGAYPPSEQEQQENARRGVPPWGEVQEPAQGDPDIIKR